MGYRVFAFSRGRAKEELARKLGAHEYFDTTEEGFVEKVKVSEEDSISSTFSFFPAHPPSSSSSSSSSSSCSL